VNVRYPRSLRRGAKGRRIARNFDRGVNNYHVSTCEYLMPLVFKASSIKGAFFWCFFSE